MADEEYKPGDTLVLREYDPETKRYTGRVLERKIVYVLKTKDLRFWEREEIDKFGFVVIGIEK